MAKVPENETLYNTIVKQVMAQYPSHRRPGGMTWQAAKKISQQYAAKGGQYVASRNEVPPQFRDNIKRAEDKKKARERRVAEEKKKRNLL